MQHKFTVKGCLTIPITFPIYSTSKATALAEVRRKLNSEIISVIDGDIHTWSGNSYPMIIRKCTIEWTEVSD
jgi:hypothetical protein